MRTRLVSSSDTEGGPLYVTKPLVDAYTPLIYLAARLYRDARPAGSPEDFRRHLERELVRARETALDRGVPEAEIADAEFAVVATLNEAVRSAGGGLRSVWDAMPLEARTRLGGLAGHDFYGNLSRVEREGREGPLTIFLLCLLAGFQGQLARDSRDRERRRAALVARLADRGADSALTPPVQVQSPPPVERPTHLPFRTLATAAGLGGAMLALVTLLWVWLWAGKLATELEAPQRAVAAAGGATP